MEAGAALEAGALVLRDRAHSQALALPQNGTTESEAGVTFGFLTAKIQVLLILLTSLSINSLVHYGCESCTTIVSEEFIF
ncbi:uncharacterized protein ACOB8E_024562 isoform 3-T7 [Sarcophilus harrisii]